jgi:hypothetical protein
VKWRKYSREVRHMHAAAVKKSTIHAQLNARLLQSC